MHCPRLQTHGGPPRDTPKILRISPGITATGSKTTTWLYKLHQPASQQARRQARQQASEQASTTVTQQASKQTNEPTSQHARKQANKPTSKHASKAGSRRTSERKAATTNSRQAFTSDMRRLSNLEVDVAFSKSRRSRSASEKSMLGI